MAKEEKEKLTLALGYAVEGAAEGVSKESAKSRFSQALTALKKICSKSEIDALYTDVLSDTKYDIVRAEIATILPEQVAAERAAAEAKAAAEAEAARAAAEAAAKRAMNEETVRSFGNKSLQDQLETIGAYNDASTAIGNDPLAFRAEAERGSNPAFYINMLHKMVAKAVAAKSTTAAEGSIEPIDRINLTVSIQELVRGSKDITGDKEIILKYCNKIVREELKSKNIKFDRTWQEWFNDLADTVRGSGKQQRAAKAALGCVGLNVAKFVDDHREVTTKVPPPHTPASNTGVGIP